MPDTPAMIYCHGCGRESGPSEAEDGQKRRCSYCTMNVTIIRYAERHPRSKIGVNARPVNGRPGPTGTRAYSEPGKIVVPRNPARVKRPSHIRVVRPDDNADSTGQQMRAIAQDMQRMVQDRQSRRIAQTREVELYHAQTPSNVPYCEDCVAGNFKPNGTFPVAEFSGYEQGTSNLKTLCKDHMNARYRGFMLPRIPGETIKRLAQTSPPPSGTYTGIGDLPVNPLAIERARIAEAEVEAETKANSQ